MTDPGSEPASQGPALTRSSSVSAVAWSAVSVGGRAAFQLVFSIVLAHLLGPERFGAINIATVYVMLSMILLDQGMAAGLVQRKDLSRRLPGATMSVNLVMSLLLAGITFGCAPWVASFFDAPILVELLRWLGLGLLIKALAITPRALLARELRFRPIGRADVLGTAFGSACGIAAALAGAGEMSLVVQTFAMDALIAVLLISRTRGPLPNAAFGELRAIVAFSLRIFGSTAIAFIPRNIDNILIGRVLGLEPLALYAVGYRMLGMPVQLLGQTARRVLFPAFSRMAGDTRQARVALLSASRWLALATIPLMTLLAVSAWQLVPFVFGERWLPAAPLVAVLAIGGAREAIFYPTPALLNGFGRADLSLRLEWLSSGTQVAAILIGLPFGVLGVAVSYVVGGFCLTPVLLWAQHRIAGVRPRAFAQAVLPALHASLWGCLTYLLVARLVAERLPNLAVLLLGGLGYLAVLTIVLFVAHRPLLIEAISFLPGGGRGRHRAGLRTPGETS